MTASSVVRPVVYLGPSCPPQDIRAALPDAVIRPPLRRGDLYRDRMLRFSAFLIVDGVFAQEDAVPPREVVDVLRDGATVLGAASMGALRATDCAPAGAVGAGHVYRLFATGALASEDEVAVLFDPDAPFPALSESLVNMRLALRRAVRSGALDRDRARTIAGAAAGLHFSRRGWQAAFRGAGLAGLWPELRPVLTACDVKRADAGLGARRLAALLRADPARLHRGRPPGPLGRAGLARERDADPLRGLDEEAAALDFTLWMLAGGRAARYLPDTWRSLQSLVAAGLDSAVPQGNCRTGPAPVAAAARVYGRLAAALRGAGEFQAEWFRHLALDQAGQRVETPSGTALRLAEARIATEHGAEDWFEVCAAAGDAAVFCEWARDRLARGMDWARRE